MRGTWQGSGTWQSSGPDLGGLVVPVVLVAVAVAVVEFILSIIVWLAAFKPRAWSWSSSPRA